MLDTLLTRIGLRKAAPERAILRDAAGLPRFNDALLARKIAERERREQSAPVNGKGVTVRRIPGTIIPQHNGMQRKDYQPVAIFNDQIGNPPSIRVRDISTSTTTGNYWTGGTNNYGVAAVQGYQHNSDVFACIDLISRAGAQVKWWDGGDGTKSISPAADLVKAVGIDPAHFATSVFSGEAKLMRAADPRASVELLMKSGGSQFISDWLSYILLSGNCYIEIARKTTNGPPSHLYLDNPGLVNAVVNRAAEHADTMVDSWRVRNGYGIVRHLAPWREGRGDIVHAKLFHPIDPIYGMSPLEAAMLRVGVQNKSEALINRVLEKGVVPGWIEAKDGTEWNAEQVAALRENLANSRAESREFFFEGATWHPMGFEPVSTGMADQQLLSKRDICSVFHVDPALVGDTTARTYATYRESRRGLYMEAVIPLLIEFRDAWNRTIGMELKSPLDFDRDSFDAIAAAREEAADRVHKLWTSGVITQNEARGDLEYQRVEGGDQFYAPANFVPMSTEPAVIEDDDE